MLKLAVLYFIGISKNFFPTKKRQTSHRNFFVFTITEFRLTKLSEQSEFFRGYPLKFSESTDPSRTFSPDSNERKRL
ncbi:hypothetical protein LEP1GSC188_3947 [Leptospira weilii serovar Topaz str. LT2116]|uniref:Uncharacterized protein n=1 Tax=Leptospira weilii serovar Topaz str. LT2116 TaxID=1088540 RepID=M3EI15_9LEPT|nr:hypothetical protein LEP1GSC188_3947 [Leptospira weilii serovar Topaz str. LT2116]